MVQEERSLMDVIWSRKKNWIGHILRGESLLREVIEGRMIGKRQRGRKRLGMLNEFLKESSYICGTKEKGRKQERVENDGSQEPTSRQNTNDDSVSRVSRLKRMTLKENIANFRIISKIV